MHLAEPAQSRESSGRESVIFRTSFNGLLTQTVELIAAQIQDVTAQVHEVTAQVHEVTAAVKSLVNIAGSHEERIHRLEAGDTPA